MVRDRARSLHAGVAVALILGLLAGAVALPHADGPGDPACAPVPIAHDASAHHFGADATPAAIDADHCVLCHSLRSFHTPFDRYQQQHETPRAERPHAAAAGAATRVDWPAVHGRAPPA